jgi:hypothetical protein
LQAETLRRPQRPGKPARVTAFLETLQQFTLGNRRKTPGIFPMLQQALKTSSRLRGSNVPQQHPSLKGKNIGGCDKTVEDGDILWKEQEKPGKTEDNTHHRDTEPNQLLLTVVTCSDTLYTKPWSRAFDTVGWRSSSAQDRKPEFSLSMRKGFACSSLL